MLSDELTVESGQTKLMGGGLIVSPSHKTQPAVVVEGGESGRIGEETAEGHKREGPAKTDQCNAAEEDNRASEAGESTLQDL